MWQRRDVFCHITWGLRSNAPLHAYYICEQKRFWLFYICFIGVFSGIRSWAVAFSWALLTRSGSTVSASNGRLDCFTRLFFSSEATIQRSQDMMPCSAFFFLFFHGALSFSLHRYPPACSAKTCYHVRLVFFGSTRALSFFMRLIISSFFYTTRSKRRIFLFLLVCALANARLPPI